MSSKLYILFIFFCVDMLYVVGFVQHFHPRFYNINESFCKAYSIFYLHLEIFCTEILKHIFCFDEPALETK